MKKKIIKRAAAALISAGVFTVAALLGLFYNIDQSISDNLYQTPKALSGNIFVIVLTTARWKISAPITPGPGYHVDGD